MTADITYPPTVSPQNKYCIIPVEQFDLDILLISVAATSHLQPLYQGTTVDHQKHTYELQELSQIIQLLLTEVTNYSLRYQAKPDETFKVPD
jgi:hypothetical protein